MFEGGKKGNLWWNLNRNASI